MLVLTAFAAMAIVIWQLYRELGPLRDEVRRLRDEVGALAIEDEAKFHAIAVRPSDDRTWKWRVWIPAEREYRLHYASEAIPKEGYAKSNGWISLDKSGEQWIEYQIRRDPVGGKWMDRLATSSGSVSGSEQAWMDWPEQASTGEGLSTSTEVFEPGKNVTLQRYRVGQTESSSQITDPAAGFMVWLESIK